MKHIKLKFLFEEKVTEQVKEVLEKNSIELNEKNYGELKKKSKASNEIPMLFTEKDFVIRAFTHNINGHTYLIPEPNFVLLYFHYAQSNYKLINEKKKELLSNLLPTKRIDENMKNQIFYFLSLTTGCTLFLFTAIEAFVNQIIPEDFVYVVERKNKTEQYSKQQLEALPFMEKLKKVLPYATKKDFMNQFPLKSIHLDNLHELRNELIHLKFHSEVERYHTITKRSLNFKYEETIHAVADLMNYYQPNYIVECDCGKD